MKKLIFLLILAVVLISKETEAISTELFACPTAGVLKNGEFLLGYRCRGGLIGSLISGDFTYLLFDIYYIRIGILNFLEIEGLVSVGDIHGSLKLVLLREKENLPQIAFMLNRGVAVEWLFEASSYTINSFGIIFSKRMYKNWQINASIFKGNTPPIWVEDSGYYNEKYSFHTTLERSIGNLKLIVELHSLPPRGNILIGGVIYKAKNFNFKLGHGFVREKDEIEHIFPFLNIEYEYKKNL